MAKHSNENDIVKISGEETLIYSQAAEMCTFIL